MKQIWELLTYFRENDFLAYNSKKYLKARKLKSYWSDFNGFYTSYTPEIGIAICFSCNQLVYTREWTKNIGNYNHIGMASHCTGNIFCDISYDKYLKIQQKSISGYYYDNEYALHGYILWMSNAIRRIKRAREAAEEARIQDVLSRLRHKLSEIQEKVKMQNSSNREMDEDSVNEGPVHDGSISTKDISPSSACLELSVISQSSASTIETYSDEEKLYMLCGSKSDTKCPQLQYTDSIISEGGTANGNVDRDITSTTPNETKFQPINANFTLLYENLCDDAIILADRKTQEAIMCYCLFGKALIKRRNEIASEKQVDPESNTPLRKRIEKTKKLYKRFDAKIYRIHSFSADRCFFTASVLFTCITYIPELDVKELLESEVSELEEAFESVEYLTPPFLLLFWRELEEAESVAFTQASSASVTISDEGVYQTHRWPEEFWYKTAINFLGPYSSFGYFHDNNQSVTNEAMVKDNINIDSSQEFCEKLVASFNLQELRESVEQVFNRATEYY
ncbi:15782_t:CDS:10 [Funneliformis mosseae]|uniref:15782_t:CDS:1 n=1 Tax=Funneliformis mosseae TaxID=27381 RepID=A0A9N9C4H1_FUNMO|nr:15782_t:CDS:10 [Funneliformis mosseae]